MISLPTIDFMGSPGGRALLFSALYFAEGAPIGFLWWALPAILRGDGETIEEIAGLTAVLVLPWALKFLWSPLLDRTGGDRGSLRTWIVRSQLAMGCTIAPLFWIDWSTGSILFTGCLILHAIAASTQDAAIDSLAIRTVPVAERGAVNGWMQAGMLIGRGLLGGGSLLLIDMFGRQGVIMLLLMAMWIPMVFAATARTAQHASAGSTGVKAIEAWKATLKTVLTDKRAIWGLLFAVLAGAAFEGVGSVAGAFLVDMDWDRGVIARFFGIDAIAAMAIGSLLGGKAADRFGRHVAVKAFTILLSLLVLLLALFVAYRSSLPEWMLIVLMTSLYGGIGLFLSASFAFLMDLTSPVYAATQFSLFMAGTNLCESWSAAAIGQMISRMGYPHAFAVMALLSLCSLPVLRKGAVHVPQSLTVPEKKPL